MSRAATTLLSCARDTFTSLQWSMMKTVRMHNVNQWLLLCVVCVGLLGQCAEEEIEGLMVTLMTFASQQE